MNRQYSSFKNTGWTIDRLHMLIVEENPCISYKDGYDKAKKIYNELKKMNENMQYNNKKYFKHNLPFSLFTETEEGDIYYLENKIYE